MELNIGNVCKSTQRTRGRPKKNPTATITQKPKKNGKILDNNEHMSQLSNENDEPKMLITQKDQSTKIMFDITESSEDEKVKKCCKKLTKELANKQQRLVELENELAEYKNNSANNVSNIIPIKINIVSDTFENQHDNTFENQFACWWCTYKFTNANCMIPNRFSNNKYYVFGNFCSYNCATSYNMNMNDCKMWERQSLLKKMHFDIYAEDIEIKLAPPKELLEKYGGPMSIAEYRKNMLLNKEYTKILPYVELMPIYIKENIRSNREMLVNVKRAKLLNKNTLNILDN
jgi:hypothetical protein